MELGIISLGDIQTNPATGFAFPAVQRIDETIGYAALADTLGLDVFALGEHHTPDHAVASPAVVLSAIAARTKNIRLTSGVTVLSTLDPVRVYQDFAQLDLISRGRTEITVGRSAYLEPFALFGENPAAYDELFAEKLDLLLRLRTERNVTWSGRFRPPLHDAAIVPRAYQNPLPVWVGVGGSPESAERAGRWGLPMVLGLIGGSIQQARRTVDIYRAAGERAGHANTLRVGISTHFYAGATASEARKVFPYYREYLRPKPPSGRGFHIDRTSFEAGTRPGQAIMIADADELIEKIVLAHDLLGVDRFFGQADWGGMPRTLVEESITRLATQIAPAVRDAVPTEQKATTR
ncbi:LLM class flavin-dependent oxidoreductase [Rhodococcus opacus]|uniref:Putative oxidoreductase n=1 Tax=Rhodococcus opacus (strain B4) TaxID=632772 RepID=C1B5S5_RHOOB|nr:LLM class flavin-dependent oxidoreductase [Rhodococcus opacus]BAH55336.1 putative oxidoreductase [Rhodococcus opacus B4]